MGLYKGTNQIKLYKGDYHPLALRVGNTQIAGYTTETETGTNAVELNNCYNEKLKAKVYGNSTQKILPDIYTQVEYLESTGTQYIDTGYKVNANTEYEVEFSYSTQLEANNGFVLGSRISSTSENISLTCDQYIFYVGRGTNYSLVNSTTLQNIKYKIKVTKTQIIKDDVLLLNSNNNFATTGTYNVNLCTCNQNGTNIRYFKGKIYRCKFSENDVLVRNFIPCYRKLDNVAGLYDTINNVFYTNAGTGTFILGPVTPTIDVPNEINSTANYNSSSGKYELKQKSTNGTNRTNLVTFPLSEPLRALECTSSDNWNVQKNGKYYIADYVDWKDKKVIRRNIKINPSVITRWQIGTASNDLYTIFQQNNFSTIPLNSLLRVKLLSNKLKYATNELTPLSDETVWLNSDNNYRALRISILNSRLSSITVAGFNTFLSTAEIEIVGVLATPIETPFTSEQLAVADLYTTPQHCEISIDSEVEPLQIDVEYAKMIN